MGNVNSMLWKSVREHPRRNEFFSQMKTAKDGDITLFTRFLPFRFLVKKAINRLGLFAVVRVIYSVIRK